MLEEFIQKKINIEKNIQDSIESVESLSKFIRFYWNVIEPGTEYTHGWHIDAICEHLEAVSHGQIRNLLINMPPRHMKSLITSVFWPVWEWLRWPNHKFLCSSYAMNLSIRDSLKCRRLIESPKFQTFHGDKFTLTKDQNAKIRFENNYYGYRLATSVGGMGTGEGGDRVICLDYRTKIKLRLGHLMIGYIVENKLPCQVLSYNKTKNRTEFKPILNWFESEVDKVIKITFKKDDFEDFLLITPNHPVFVLGKGYVNAENVQISDLLMGSDARQAHINKIEIIHEKRKMYNIEVDGNNNYYSNDILVHNCDDPHSTSQAESELKRESALVWWSETMSTRLNNPKTGAKVVIMQRQNALDLSGYILKRGGYDHVCLPAEYEGKKIFTSIGFCDPREKEGELLWPDRMGRQELDDLKKELGSYAVAGQLQQRPAPREGGIIKREWFNFFTLVKNPNGSLSMVGFDYILQSWDTSFKTGEENDYSVCTTWASNRSGYYLLNRWKSKVDFPELERVSMMLANQFMPHQILIEDKASGQSLIQALRKRTKLPIKAIKVDRDKIARMHAVSGIFEAGLVFIPNNEPFIEDYIENMINFPAAEYDDDVDSTTQAINEMAIKSKNYGTIGQNVSIIGR